MERPVQCSGPYLQHPYLFYCPSPSPRLSRLPTLKILTLPNTKSGDRDPCHCVLVSITAMDRCRKLGDFRTLSKAALLGAYKILVQHLKVDLFCWSAEDLDAATVPWAPDKCVWWLHSFHSHPVFFINMYLCSCVPQSFVMDLIFCWAFIFM